jgi:hypothetical protein
MQRDSLQLVFTLLITTQFLVIASHDLVDIPGWTHGSQVKALLGARKVWLVTLANSIFPGLACGFALYFLRRPAPGWAANYWLIYCVATVASAIFMWYVPYIFGGSEKQKLEYSRMYAGTRQVLPARGKNPRPNLLHVCFHGLFLITFSLALALRFGRG